MPRRRLLLLAAVSGAVVALVTTGLESLHPASNFVTAALLFALTAILVMTIGAMASVRAESASRAAAEGDRLRTAILRAVSHDLRTPLASIKVSATSLLQDDVDWTDEARREFLLTIDEETDRLDRIVGDLLDMSRLDAGVVRPDVTPIELSAATRVAVAGIDRTAARVTIDDRPPLLAAADEVLFERVVANLVANAIRHGGGTVEVVLRVDGADAVVDVVDHGPGMAPEDMDVVFEPFHRLGDHSPGTGLGLAVARGFVDAMGGSLSLGTTEGGGVTATVRLPAVDPRTDAPAAAAVRAAGRAVPGRPDPDDREVIRR